MDTLTAVATAAADFLVLDALRRRSALNSLASRAATMARCDSFVGDQLLERPGRLGRCPWMKRMQICTLFLPAPFSGLLRALEGTKTIGIATSPSPTMIFMASAAALAPDQPRFYQTTIGKKVIVAVTGVILFGFVVVHLAGNLLIFAGPERLNAYAAFLRSRPLLAWAARLTLLAAVVLHVTASIQLALLNRAARPVGYGRRSNLQATYASRTMIWSGPILLAFVIYHLLHFTFGSVHPAFQEFEVYHNVVTGFRSIPVAAAYIIAMILLGLHLRHGMWSMLQSVGFGDARYTPGLRRFAAAAATFIVIGNISIPLAVLTGLVR